MTAKVIPIAVGDHATTLPVERIDGECGCSPLDGCCLPERPRLVTTTEEQQDDPPADTVSDPPMFRLRGLKELVWFKIFMHDLTARYDDTDVFNTVETAVDLVESHRDMIAGLAEGLTDIEIALEAEDLYEVDEIIEEFFPAEEYPFIEDLATIDADEFFGALIALHTANPLATVEEIAKKALALVGGNDGDIQVAAFNEDIDVGVKVEGEEASLSSLRDTYAANPVTGHLDFSDFTIEEFKALNCRMSDLESELDEGTPVAEIAEAAYEDVIVARSQTQGDVRYPTAQDLGVDEVKEAVADLVDEICDWPPGVCLRADVGVDDEAAEAEALYAEADGELDDDGNEDLTHLKEIVYVYADGAQFTIEEPLYRFVLEDGTHCIEAYDIGFEIPPGFVAVVCLPVNEDDVVLQQHAD